jgi:hypothetical protein
MKPFSQLPEVQELHQTIAAKVNDLNKIKADIDLIGNQLAEGGTKDDHTSRVAAAREYAQTGVALPAAAAALHETHAHLRGLAESLEVSIKADRVALGTLQSEASVAASREVDAEHRAIAAQALEALRAFDMACAAEQALMARLAADGYDARFRQYCAWPTVGRLMDTSASAIWHFERDLSHYAKK